MFGVSVLICSSSLLFTRSHLYTDSLPSTERVTSAIFCLLRWRCTGGVCQGLFAKNSRLSVQETGPTREGAETEQWGSTGWWYVVGSTLSILNVMHLFGEVKISQHEQINSDKLKWACNQAWPEPAPVTSHTAGSCVFVFHCLCMHMLASSVHLCVENTILGREGDILPPPHCSAWFRCWSCVNYCPHLSAAAQLSACLSA